MGKIPTQKNAQYVRKYRSKRKAEKLGQEILYQTTTTSDEDEVEFRTEVDEEDLMVDDDLIESEIGSDNTSESDDEDEFIMDQLEEEEEANLNRSASIGELFDDIGGFDQAFETIPNFHVDNDESLNKPIHNDASLSLGSFITVILFLIITMKIGTSKIDILLKTLNLLLPQDNIIPKTRTQLFKFIPFMDSMQRVYYCKHCECCCNNSTCSSCGRKNTTHFLYHSLREQFEERCKDPIYCEQLEYYKTRRNDTDNIMDVFDGSVIKDKIQLHGNSNQIFLQVNWDGASPFSSSKWSMWPIYVVVQNLPPEVRYNPENLFMVGLWYGKTKPGNVFLDYFVQDVKSMENNEVIINNGSWFVNFCSIVCDLPAKAIAYCMSAFNGLFGCGFCLNSGHSIQRRWVFTITNKQYKCTPREEQDSKAAAENLQYGFKGETPLFKLDTFSWNNSQTIDVMHQVCGIFRGLVKSWRTKESKAKIPIDKWKLLNKQLENQQLPTLFKRKCRSLNDFKYWKAHEVLVFFLYLTPLMKNILDSARYEHLQLLTDSLHVLFSQSISPDNLKRVELSLIKFVFGIETLYASHYCSLNVHHLIHVCSVVKRHGPLWCFTCFPYESYNKILLSFIHGTNKVEKYASNSVSIFKQFKRLVKKEMDQKVLDLVDKHHLHSKGNHKTMADIHCTLRKEKIVHAILDGSWYCVMEKTLHSNNIVQLADNSFAVIVKFLEKQDKFYIHVRPIRNGVLANDSHSISPSEVLGPAVLVKDINEKLIVRPLLKCHAMLLR